MVSKSIDPVSIKQFDSHTVAKRPIQPLGSSKPIAKRPPALVLAPYTSSSLSNNALSPTSSAHPNLTPPNTATLFSHGSPKTLSGLVSPSNRNSIASSLAARNSLISQYSPVIEHATEVSVVASTSSPESTYPATEESTPTLGSTNSSPEIPFGGGNVLNRSSQPPTAVSTPNPNQFTTTTAASTNPESNTDFSIEHVRETTSQMESILSDIRNLRQASRTQTVSSEPIPTDLSTDESQINTESEESLFIPKSRSQPLPTTKSQLEVSDSDISNSEHEYRNGESSSSDRTSSGVAINTGGDDLPASTSPVLSSIAPPPASMAYSTVESKNIPRSSITVSEQSTDPGVVSTSAKPPSALPTSGDTHATFTDSNDPSSGYHYNPVPNTSMTGFPSSVLNKDLPALPLDQHPIGGDNRNLNTNTNNSNSPLDSLNPQVPRKDSEHDTSSTNDAADSQSVTVIPVSGPDLVVPQHPLPPPPKSGLRGRQHSRSHSLPVRFADPEGQEKKLATGNSEEEHSHESADDSQHSSGGTQNETSTPSSIIFNSDMGISSSGSSSNTPRSKSETTPSFSTSEGASNPPAHLSPVNSSVVRPSSNILPRPTSTYSSASYNALPLSNQQKHNSLGFGGDLENNLSPSTSYRTALSPTQKQSKFGVVGSPDLSLDTHQNLITPPPMPFAKSGTNSFLGHQSSPAESFNTARTDFSAPNSPETNKQRQLQPIPTNKDNENTMAGNSGISLTDGQSRSSTTHQVYNTDGNNINMKELPVSSETSGKPLGPEFNPTKVSPSLLAIYSSPPIPTATLSTGPAESSFRASIDNSALDSSTTEPTNIYSQVQPNVSSTVAAKDSSFVSTDGADQLYLMPKQKLSSSFSENDIASHLSKQPNTSSSEPTTKRKNNNLSSWLSFVPSPLKRDSTNVGTNPADKTNNTPLLIPIQTPGNNLADQNVSSGYVDSNKQKMSSSYSAPVVAPSKLDNHGTTSQLASPNARQSTSSYDSKKTKSDLRRLHTRDFRTSNSPGSFVIPPFNPANQQSPVTVKSERPYSMPPTTPAVSNPVPVSEPSSVYSKAGQSRRTSLESSGYQKHGRTSSELSRNNARRGRRDRNSGSSFKSFEKHGARPSDRRPQTPPSPPQHKVSLEQVSQSQNRTVSTASTVKPYQKPIDGEEHGTQPVSDSLPKPNDAGYKKGSPDTNDLQKEQASEKETYQKIPGSQWTNLNMAESDSRSERYEHDDGYNSAVDDIKREEHRAKDDGFSTHRHENKHAQFVDDDHSLYYDKPTNYGRTRPSGKRIVSGGNVRPRSAVSSSSSSSLQKMPQPSRGHQTRIHRSSRVSSLGAPPLTPKHFSTSTPMAAAAAAASAAASAAAAAAALIVKSVESSYYDYNLSSRQSSDATLERKTRLKRGPSEKFTKFSKQFAETFRDDLEPELSDAEEEKQRSSSSYNNHDSKHRNDKHHQDEEYRAAHPVSSGPRKSKPPKAFTQSNIQYLMELSDATFCLDQIDIPATERQLIEKFVDALAKLSTDISADSQKRREGVRRLNNALSAIEGWI